MKAQKEEASKNIAATSNGVQEVVDIMKTNVESVLERGIKMAELGDRVNALEQGASQFELNGGKLKQKNFIKDKRWTVIAILGAVFFVAFLLWMFH